jgi:hypothetical protein
LSRPTASSQLFARSDAWYSRSLKRVGDPEQRVAFRKMKLARHHADHRERRIVEVGLGGELSADDARVAAELGLPQAVAENDGSRRAGPIVLGGERPTDDRDDTEGREQIRAHRRAVEPARLAGADQRDLVEVIHPIDSNDRAPPSSRGSSARTSPCRDSRASLSQILTRREGSGNGSGRMRTKSVTENAAVVAPMPSATIRDGGDGEAGARRSMRPL